MPKVSICIPTYNQINFLKVNLDSIVVQNFTDYEVVITDDTFDDKVREFILNYSNFFGDKLKYFKNPCRLGTPENWNEAIRKSRGEYIKILHHDDSFSGKNSLFDFVQLLENNPQIDFAFSATFVSSENQVHKISLDDVEKLKKNPLLLISNNLIGAPSTSIFRRRQGLFFDKNLKWLVDIEFYIRSIVKNNFLFIYSSDILVTTCSGASHQVTNECLDNKEVEVYEYSYLLNKIYTYKNFYTAAALKKCVLQVINIYKKHEIKSAEDLRNCGYRGNIHGSIKSWLVINACSSTLGKFYLKILRRL